MITFTASCLEMLRLEPMTGPIYIPAKALLAPCRKICDHECSRIKEHFHVEAVVSRSAVAERLCINETVAERVGLCTWCLPLFCYSLSTVNHVSFQASRWPIASLS